MSKSNQNFSPKSSKTYYNYFIRITSIHKHRLLSLRQETRQELLVQYKDEFIYVTIKELQNLDQLNKSSLYNCLLIMCEVVRLLNSYGVSYNVDYSNRLFTSLLNLTISGISTKKQIELVLNHRL